MNEKIANSLKSVWKDMEETSVVEASAGELGAENDSTPDDDVDAYLTDMVDDLLANYDTDEDDAIDFVFSVIDEVAEEGAIPEFPEDTATAEEMAAWLGKAKTAGLHIRVARAAEESAE